MLVEMLKLNASTILNGGFFQHLYTTSNFLSFSGMVLDIRIHFFLNSGFTGCVIICAFVVNLVKKIFI